MSSSLMTKFSFQNLYDEVTVVVVVAVKSPEFIPSGKQ
mgnify:CR=1 FL=1